MRLGELLSEGANALAEHVEQASGLWTLACEQGAWKACSHLAFLRIDQGSYREALAYGSRACLRREAEGCTAVGLLAFRGWGTARRWARAQKLWEYSCQQGHDLACAYLGILKLKSGRGGRVGVRGSFTRTCAKPKHIGCSYLGAMAESGLGGAQDFELALRSYLRGCEQGHAESCVRGGLAIEENSDDIRHLRRARGMYELGCTARGGGVCAVDGDTTLAGTARGEALARRDCAGADARALACYNAGLAYEKLTLESADAAHVQKFLDQACKAGLGKACRGAVVHVTH